jgi:hypothetical protein
MVRTRWVWGHIYCVWLMTFSLLYWKGLGSWLECYRKRGPHLDRLSQWKLKIPIQCSGLDGFGGHTCSVWSTTFSLLHSKVDGNFVAGLGYWLGSYREWGPHLPRLSERKLVEIPMYWSELDWYGAHTYYVWWKTFSLLYWKGLGSWLECYRKRGSHLDRLSQWKLKIPIQCSGLDGFGGHTCFVWSTTFSLLHSKVDGNFVAGLGYWLDSYREWGPPLPRLSERKLEIPMCIGQN